MKPFLPLLVFFIVVPAIGRQNGLAQSNTALSADGEIADLRVILLGTGGGPSPNAQRFGISTLVIAGTEKLMFDCGRAATIRMGQLGIRLGEVTKLFVTHLHSDHVIGIPDLYLTGWASQGRQTSFQVWGPPGTRDMMEHLQKAFAFDIHIRRDVDEKFPAEGIKMTATDIREGVVYESNGVKVTAFLVDHGPVKPAFGYRVDYRGHSVVMSGDTKPSENLIRFSEGVDLLIHEVGQYKQDPILTGPPNEIVSGPNLQQMTREQMRIVAAHHTDGVEAGHVFARVKPRLAIFSHGGGPATIPLVRRNYSGPVEIGEDLMTMDVGEKIEIHRFKFDSK
jgi:ribonuclease Z